MLTLQHGQFNTVVAIFTAGKSIAMYKRKYGIMDENQVSFWKKLTTLSAVITEVPTIVKTVTSSIWVDAFAIFAF